MLKYLNILKEFPQLRDVGGQDDVRVQDDDLLEILRQNFVERKFHEAEYPRVVCGRDPRDIVDDVIIGVERHQDWRKYSIILARQQGKKSEAEKSTEIELSLTIFGRFLEGNLSLTIFGRPNFSLTIFGRPSLNLY